MPRRWIEHIHDWPSLSDADQYLLRVTAVEKSVDPPGIRVQFEFIDGEQLGRTHVAVLPLPVRPAGLTVDFFVAAGRDIIVGGTVSPKLAVGKVIRAGFATGAPNEPWQIVRFAPADES